MTPFLRVVLGAALLAPLGVADGVGGASADDLSSMSLEQLINVDVTSAAKKTQKLTKVPAAIYVITADDIRRSGAITIPDVLRMAPGIQVARINASSWAISARGFNGKWANKLLVLIDGRTVYSPLFGGVYWDSQDVMLEDIDRIEVIRGPGATMWGANAVDGVINIVTKKASETRGGLISAAAGSEDKAQVGVRYGGEIGPHAWYRAFAKYSDYDGLTALGQPGTQPANDGWDLMHGGFRIDWNASSHDSLTLQGDAYSGSERELVEQVILRTPWSTWSRRTMSPEGGSLLARWNHVSEYGAETTVLTYFDHTQRGDGITAENVNTFDLDVQHRMARIGRHDIQFGVEGRFTGETLQAAPGTVLHPDPLDDAVASAFVQDEMMLVEDRLSMIVGTKLERTSYTTVELEPSAELVWTPAAWQTVWISAAQADRTPALIDRSARFDLAAGPGPGGMPMVISVFGNADVRPEDVTAYQSGYRVNAAERVAVDLTGFYSLYNNLRTTEAGTPYMEQGPGLPPHLVVPMIAQNELAARSWGGEASVTWQPAEWWRLSGGYSWLRIHRASTTNDPETELISIDSPVHQAQLRSFLDLPGKTSLDIMAYYTSDLPAHLVGLPRPGIPAYARLDAHLSRRFSDRMEASVVLQDALNSGHLEFIDRWGVNGPPEQTGRSAYAKLTLRF